MAEARRGCASKPQNAPQRQHGLPNCKEVEETTTENGKLNGSEIDPGTQNGSTHGTEKASGKRNASEDGRPWRSGRQNGNKTGTETEDDRCLVPEMGFTTLLPHPSFPQFLHTLLGSLTVFPGRPTCLQAQPLNALQGHTLSLLYILDVDGNSHTFLLTPLPSIANRQKTTRRCSSSLAKASDKQPAFVARNELFLAAPKFRAGIVACKCSSDDRLCDLARWFLSRSLT